jgi:hypothetical protein
MHPVAAEAKCKTENNEYSSKNKYCKNGHIFTKIRASFEKQKLVNTEMWEIMWEINRKNVGFVD